MSERDRKKEGAMRLFGALSGVDEKYLAGCGTAEKAAEKKAAIFRRTGSFVRRYGIAAAALGVLALGTWSYVFRSSSGGDKPMLQNQTSFRSEEAAQDGASLSGIAPETNGSAMSAQGPGEAFDGIAQGEDSLTEESVETGAVTLEQARRIPGVGEYLPEALPGDGGSCELYADAREGQEKITLEWNAETGAGASASEGFRLVIENLGEARPSLADSPTVLAAEELTRQNVADALGEYSQAPAVEEKLNKEEDPTADLAKAQSESALGVLYEKEGNYVLLTYRGGLSAEQVWEMLSSVQK